MKPGWQTTEFWLALCGLAAGVVLVVTGHEELGKWLLAAVLAAYPISRGIAKAGAKG